MQRPQEAWSPTKSSVVLLFRAQRRADKFGFLYLAHSPARLSHSALDVGLEAYRKIWATSLMNCYCTCCIQFPLYYCSIGIFICLGKTPPYCFTLWKFCILLQKTLLQKHSCVWMLNFKVHLESTNNSSDEVPLFLNKTDKREEMTSLVYFVMEF